MNMEENQSKKKVNLVYVIIPVLLIVSIIELILLIKPNKQLKSNTIKPNYDEEIKLGDILFDSDYVSYDNTNSGLSSTTVQDAIDELYSAANTCTTNLGTCNSNLSTCQTDLAAAQTNMATYRDEICPGCVYSMHTRLKYNSNSSVANGTNNVLSSSEYTTDYTTLNSNYFLGHVIDANGYILSSYACGINNGTFFCLRGVDSSQSSLTYKPFYQEAVNRMNKAFPSCNATTSSSRASCTGGVYAEANSDGGVSVDGDDDYCYVGTDGSSYCCGGVC